MNPKPRQLTLPFHGARKPHSPLQEETLRRLARIESRLVQLMKHQGMVSDGRAPLPSSTD